MSTAPPRRNEACCSPAMLEDYRIHRAHELHYSLARCRIIAMMGLEEIQDAGTLAEAKRAAYRIAEAMDEAMEELVKSVKRKP